jgi:hypothetical protein
VGVARLHRVLNSHCSTHCSRCPRPPSLPPLFPQGVRKAGPHALGGWRAGAGACSRAHTRGDLHHCGRARGLGLCGRAGHNAGAMGQQDRRVLGRSNAAACLPDAERRTGMGLLGVPSRNQLTCTQLGCLSDSRRACAVCAHFQPPKLIISFPVSQLRPTPFCTAFSP